MSSDELRWAIGLVAGFGTLGPRGLAPLQPSWRRIDTHFEGGQPQPGVIPLQIHFEFGWYR